MNFYKHHIGDYAQATAHLSFVEDAAYSRLIRKYYAEEKPLPLEVKAVQRLIGARTKEEKQAVEDVLQEFFTQESDGWHNKRCDAEIEANRELDADREAKNANEKERQRRHREERAKLFEALRGLNIVPAYDTKTETLRSLLSNALVTPPVTRDDIGMSQPVTPPVTRNATATQTPDTRHQTPEVNLSVTDVTGGKPPAMTPDEIIFGYGVPLLTNAGTAEKQARSFLGGLRKAHGDAALIDKLRECLRAKPLQPLEWLAKALPPSGINGSSKQTQLESRNATVVDGWVPPELRQEAAA